MYYKKVKLVFKYCQAKRFFRTFLVDENINLVDLGCAFVTALNGAYEHNFLFETKSKVYNPRSFMDDFVFDDDVLMNDYSLKDLGDKFEFTYDTGEGWDFKATVKETKIEIGEKEIELIDGAGLGIWEDNIATFYAYLEGEIDPNSLDVDEERGIYPPWNMEIEKYGDFDEYNLEEAKEEFYDLYSVDKDEYKENEKKLFSNENSDDIDDEDIECLFPPLFYNMIIDTIEEFIENPEINIIYNKLKVKYGQNKIKELFAKEFIFQQFQNSKKQKAFDLNKFIEDIKKID